MSTVPKTVTTDVLGHGVPAANADQLGERGAAPASHESTGGWDVSTGGWDAYDVWRRFIKDARDRRKLQDPN